MTMVLLYMSPIGTTSERSHLIEFIDYDSDDAMADAPTKVDVDPYAGTRSIQYNELHLLVY